MTTTKTTLLLSVLLIVKLCNSQIYTPGSSVGLSSSGTDVGIGTSSPNQLLDVRGASTFGGGLTKFDYNWAQLPNERSLILTGIPRGYGTMLLGHNDLEASGQTLGFFLFGQKVGSKYSVTNAGLKAAISSETSGSGGTTSGFGGNLLFRTTGDNNAQILIEHMRLDLNGNLGIGTPAPSEQLHTTYGVRFEGLSVSTQSFIVSIDPTGKLFKMATPSSGITNACATTNFVPKTSSGGNLTCSQIFDDGTSIGIGTTTGFAYTWPGGLTGTIAPPTSGTVKLNINGVSKALAYFATSDIRFKKDIKTISNAIDILKKIEGKTYLWKSEEFKDKGFSNVKQYGFIAQELEKIIPEVVATDEIGFKSVSYDMIIPILVQGVKEQSSVIESQQKQIDELKSMVNSLAISIANNNNNNNGNNTSSQVLSLNDKNAIVLSQNVPNPFAESTVITYNIPSDFSKAQFIFTTIEGKIIKTADLKQKGFGTLNVFANDLSTGFYSYSLIVDGKVIDTKKMIKE
jgi:hypothetical protein